MTKWYRQLLVGLAVALAGTGCGGTFDRNNPIEVTTDRDSYPNDVMIQAYITNWTNCTVTLSQCAQLVKLSEGGQPQDVVDTVCARTAPSLDTGVSEQATFEPWGHPPGQYKVFVGVSGCATRSPASSDAFEIR